VENKDAPEIQYLKLTEKGKFNLVLKQVFFINDKIEIQVCIVYAFSGFPSI